MTFSQCPFQMVTNPCISGDVYQKRESLHMCVLCVLYMQATEEDLNCSVAHPLIMSASESLKPYLPFRNSLQRERHTHNGMVDS